MEGQDTRTNSGDNETAYPVDAHVYRQHLLLVVGAEVAVGTAAPKSQGDAVGGCVQSSLGAVVEVEFGVGVVILVAETLLVSIPVEFAIVSAAMPAPVAGGTEVDGVSSHCCAGHWRRRIMAFAVDNGDGRDGGQTGAPGEQIPIPSEAWKPAGGTQAHSPELTH